MGNSAYATLAYGYDLGDMNLEDSFLYSFDDWWYYTRHLFVPTFNVWNENGGYADGVSHNDPRIATYMTERAAHKATIPAPPVEFVDYGCTSGGDERLLLVMPGTVTRADWYSPTALHSDALDLCRHPRSAWIAFHEFSHDVILPEIRRIREYASWEFPKSLWLLSASYG